jgi:hypothetical protein
MTGADGAAHTCDPIQAIGQQNGVGRPGWFFRRDYRDTNKDNHKTQNKTYH